MRILVTGGAGFVGSNLALFLKRDHGDAEVIAFDNLKRRGSELTLNRLRKGGVSFSHGDVRSSEDLADMGEINLLVDCSAEPSVRAGYDARTAYLVNTNLVGTINCLEYVSRYQSDVVFLSTSRVYPVEPLRSLPLVRSRERLVIPAGASGLGWSAEGITSEFPLYDGTRSLYGATKLCSELLIAEYADLYRLRTVVNRCGVLSGPWQMGKVDQGFVVLWASRHLYGGRLSYQGFGGEGLQVRDVLHVADLYDLIRLQLSDLDKHSVQVFNVGGGTGHSISLRELTSMCREISGHSIEIGCSPQTQAGDIPYYVTDNSQIAFAAGWEPRHTLDRMLEEIFRWLADHRSELEWILS